MRVLCLGETDERALAVAACMRRLVEAATDVHTSATDLPLTSARSLRADRRLASRAVSDENRHSLDYIPSTAAKRELFATREGPEWPRRVEKYMRQDVQPVPGAIFRLPLYGRADFIEAFITDWSPFPAACAMAVHPSHPLGDSCDNQPNRWTGHYARHVLTGDLLAIWTAGWVRPAFGTGAVIVNPAHSAADLAFAQTVGLPIRFGLAPVPPPSADPASWLDPPVINTGYAVRTGVADGEPADAARRTYYAFLEAAGHAWTFTDHVLPPLPIGSTTNLRTLDDLKLRDPVREILERPVAEEDIVVASASDIGELVAMRALHLDTHSVDIPGAGVLLVQPAAAGDPAAIGSRERELALIGFGRLDEVLTLKGPQIEQAGRFYDNHEKLTSGEAVDLSDKPPKRVARLLSDAKSGQLGLAFAELYKLQRDLKQKPESVGKGDRYAYFAAAYALAGTPLPEGYPIADVLRGGR